MSSAPPSFSTMCTVGRQRNIVVVTRCPEAAAQWVRELHPDFMGKQKVVGVSFSWTQRPGPDGFAVEKVQSIHLSFLSGVLIYYLGSADLRSFELEFLAFLINPDHIFVGIDIAAAFESLGLSRIFRGRARLIDLWEAAGRCGLHRLAATYPVGFPMYAAMVEAIAKDVDASTLLPLDMLRASWIWPPSPAQVECAVQTAVNFQNIGLAALSPNGPSIGEP